MWHSWGELSDGAANGAPMNAWLHVGENFERWCNSSDLQQHLTFARAELKCNGMNLL
jgi:hypothetical protein